MGLKYTAALKAARLTLVKAAIDAGPGAGYIEIRTGSQPANPDAAATGTLLATLTFSDPCGVVTTVLTMSAITRDSVADNPGTASYFRAYDSTGAAVLDGNVGAVGSGAPLELITTAIIAGQPVEISSFVLTPGN